MPKELPYFQFIPSDYLSGSITFCSWEAQGVFIHICAMYWNRAGKLTLAQIKRKYPENVVQELVDEMIIKSSSNDDQDNIVIDFLDEQLSNLAENANSQRKKALKGWETRRKKREKQINIKSSSNDDHIINLDIDKDKESDNDKDIPPKSPKGEGAQIDAQIIYERIKEIYPEPFTGNPLQAYAQQRAQNLRDWPDDETLMKRVTAYLNDCKQNDRKPKFFNNFWLDEWWKEEWENIGKPKNNGHTKPRSIEDLCKLFHEAVKYFEDHPKMKQLVDNKLRNGAYNTLTTWEEYFEEIEAERPRGW